MIDDSMPVEEKLSLTNRLLESKSPYVSFRTTDRPF